MFGTGKHKDLARSLESIGAAFAIYERCLKNNNFILVSANSLYEEVSGKPLEECIDQPIQTFMPRYVQAPMVECLLDSLKTQSSREKEIIVEHGLSSRWWRIVSTPIIQEQHDFERVINTCIEITDKKLLEKELDVVRQRFQAVIETAYDGIITIDENQEIKLMNQSARDIFGLNQENPIGKSLLDYIPMKFRTKHKEYVKSFRKSPINARPMQTRSSVLGLRIDGSEFPLEVTISKIMVDSNVEMTAVIRDISEKARLIDELSKAATQDPLTEIFNRRYLLRTLSGELSRCRRFERPLSLVMFDLDHFKKVNDVYGHPCGDEVLKQAVETVQNKLRETDVFCRWGGEEFLILLPETHLENALKLAERSRQAIEDLRVPHHGQSISVTASFGVLETRGNEPLETILKNTDEALYQAKQNGRNCVVQHQKNP